MSKQPETMTKSTVDQGVPISVKIRERVLAANQRFNANDNIAEFIQPGELEALLQEVEDKMRGVLDSLVIDTQNDHNTNETAKRVAKMYIKEVFNGRYVKSPEITEFPNATISAPSSAKSGLAYCRIKTPTSSACLSTPDWPNG